MFKILVAEDDKDTARLMKAVLSHAGYEVILAKDGMDALQQMEYEKIDLFILDIMMPKMDGITFTKELRDCGDMTPILMVTAKHLPKDRYEGFLAGTDDYMVKPVDEEEMLFRIKALLRRSQIAMEHKLDIGAITLDYDALTVTRDNQTETLPAKEFYLYISCCLIPIKYSQGYS